MKNYKIIQIVLDLIIANLLFFSILWFYKLSYENSYVWLVIIANILFIISIYNTKIYQKIHNNIYQSFVKNLQTWLIIGAILTTIIFIFNLVVARKIILLWIIITPIIITFIRLFLQKINKKPQINILMLGDLYQWTQYEKYRLQKQNIKIYYIKNIDENIKNSITIVIMKNSIDNIIINSQDKNLISTLTEFNLQGLKYLTISHFMENYLRKCYIDKRDLNYLGEINRLQSKQKIIKLVIDYCMALLLIILTIPIIIISSFIIKTQSMGKIIFTQPRIGLNNKDFIIYKFRSMYENSDFDPYTQKNDKRIFPYGNFIRKTRIDELPQLINVLKQDMHIIGPRAEWNILSKKYLSDIPYYYMRNVVKPGISGWAQVNYPYGANIEDAKQKLMYDLYYIKNWSFALELETIIKTIIVVFKNKGL